MSRRSSFDDWQLKQMNPKESVPFASTYAILYAANLFHFLDPFLFLCLSISQKSLLTSEMSNVFLLTSQYICYCMMKL